MKEKEERERLVADKRKAKHCVQDGLGLQIGCWTGTCQELTRRCKCNSNVCFGNSQSHFIRGRQVERKDISEIGDPTHQ